MCHADPSQVITPLPRASSAGSGRRRRSLGRSSGVPEGHDVPFGVDRDSRSPGSAEKSRLPLRSSNSWRGGLVLPLSRQNRLDIRLPDRLRPELDVFPWGVSGLFGTVEDVAKTFSSTKNGASQRTASESASDGRQSTSTSRSLARSDTRAINTLAP